MAQVMIKNLQHDTIKLLKMRAKLHLRSLQDELKAILEAATKMTMEEARRRSKAWHKRLSGKVFTDSAEQSRKDRER